MQFKSGALVGDPQPLNAAGVATLSGSWLGPGPRDVTAEYGGDYRRAEMVKAFLSSIEYRQRFGR